MLTDAVLVERVIAGFDDAFDELYRRHAAAAWRLGQAVTGSPHDAADAVSEAFARVLQAVRNGRLDDGSAFRSYLLTATRNAALDGMRRTGKARPTDGGEMTSMASGSPSPADTLVDGADAALIAAAFRNLPERWRSVLWLTEVEGVATRDAAEQLGLSPNGAAQLAVRARAGLRERYLQAHLRDAGQSDCRFTVDRLGAYVGGGLSARDLAKVDQHLAGCEDCAARKAELEDVGSSLRRIALPIPLALAGMAGHRVEQALAASSSVPATAGFGKVVDWAKEPSPLVRKLVGASAAGILGLGVLALSFVGGPDVAVADLTTPKAQGPLRALNLPDGREIASVDLPSSGTAIGRPSFAAPTTGGTDRPRTIVNVGPGTAAPAPSAKPAPKPSAPAASRPDGGVGESPLGGLLPPEIGGLLEEPVQVGVGGSVAGNEVGVAVEVDEAPTVVITVNDTEIAPLAGEPADVPEEDGLSIRLGGEEVLGLP